MDLTDIVRLLRRGLWILIATTILGVAAGAIVFSLTPPTFQATTRLFVAVQTGETSAAGLGQSSSASQLKVAAYVPVVTSQPVLDPVVKSEGLQTSASALAAQITATPAASQLIEISVTDHNPRRAAALANAVAKSFSTVVAELEQPLADGSSPVRISTLKTAAVPGAPVAPKATYDIALGGIVGLVIGLAFVFVRSMVDTRVRSVADLAALDAPVLGTIAVNPDQDTTPLVVHATARSPLAESFRGLRTNIAYSSSNETTRIVLLTSAMPSEGKSTTIANLALATAETEARVLLIDADLRRPRIAELFGIEGAAGLTDVLVGRAEPADVIQRWGSGGLDILPAGHVPPNPGELLGSESMRQLLALFADEYDAILIDSPPVLPVTDAAVLSAVCTDVVLVAASRQTRRPQLQSARQRLEAIGASVRGVVITKLHSRNRDLGYGSYSTYGEYTSTLPATGAAPTASLRTRTARRKASV